MKKIPTTLILSLIFLQCINAQNWTWLNQVAYDVNIRDFAIEETVVAMVGESCEEALLSNAMIQGLAYTTDCSPPPSSYPSYHSYIALVGIENGDVKKFIEFEGLRLSEVDIKQNQIVVAGSFIDTLEINNQTFYAEGDADQVILSMDINGTINWVRTIGSSGLDYMHDVLMNEEGSVYFASSIYDRVTIDNESYDKGKLIGKIDDDGNFSWLANAFSLFTTIEEIALDSEDNLLVTGLFTGSMRVQNLYLDVEGNHFTGFVLKLDADGEATWVKEINGAAAPDFIGGLNVDDQNNVYVSGATTGNTQFGDSLYLANDQQSAFLVKFRSDGSVEQILKDDTERSHFVDFKITPDQKIFLVNEVPGESIYPLALVQNIEVYLTELDADFNPIATGLPYKIRDFVGEFDEATQLILDQNGDIYLSRRYYNLSIFNDELVDSTYYNSFIGKIEDADFVSSTEFPPISSTKDRLAASNIKIFPNPIHDECQIDLGERTGKLTVRIINQQGQLMRNISQYNNQEKISLRDFPSGVYFLSLIEEEQISTHKIIKQ